MIHVNCPACGREYDFADYLGGLTVVCKDCSRPVPVPASKPNSRAAGDAIQATPNAVSSRSGPQHESAARSQAIQAASGVRPDPPKPAYPLPLAEDSTAGDTPLVSVLLPDWAIEHVRVCLKFDMSVPDIKKRLVARGLTPATAAAAVEKALEERVQQRFETEHRAERLLRLQRIVSAIAACTCLVLAYRDNGIPSAARTSAWILVPLAYIWFGSKLRARFAYTQGTPEYVLRLVGWLVLIAVGFFRLALLLTFR